MPRPKMKRVNVSIDNPRVHISPEGRDILREEIKKRGLSQRGVGREIGVSESVSNHIFTDGTVDLSVLRLMRDKLDIKVIFDEMTDVGVKV